MDGSRLLSILNTLWYLKRRKEKNLAGHPIAFESRRADQKESFHHLQTILLFYFIRSAIGLGPIHCQPVSVCGVETWRGGGGNSPIMAAQG